MTDHFDSLRKVLGAFELGETLGRGSWGVVLAGHHRHLERDVAVKVLPPDLTSDPAVRRRFAREARLLASLDHPHVVRIYDYVETDDVCALVMERLRGGTLADRARVTTMSRPTACALQMAALHGLEHAHQHSVLHRDVKPDNLMLSEAGVLKVTDFGISIVLGTQLERMTVAGVALGTPAYMAPEQLDESSPVGPPTDVWSAGAVLYELLSGSVPYPARDTLQASMLARVSEEPRPIRDLVDDLPAPLARTVMRSLSRDPADRYARSGEFADALEEAASEVWGPEWLASTSVPVHRTPFRPPALPTTGSSTIGATPADEGTPSRSGRARLLLVGSALAVAVAGTVTVLVLNAGSDDPGGAEDSGATEGPTTSTVTDIDVPPRPDDLPPLPPGWPTTLPVGVLLPDEYAAQVASAFDEGLGSLLYLSGDPMRPGTGWHIEGDKPALRLVTTTAESGVRPSIGYYVLRMVGQPPDVDADDAQTLEILASRPRMTAYWRDVRALLGQLGESEVPVPLIVEPSVFGIVESRIAPSPDATTVPTAVASTGTPGLEGLPDDFSGFAQAWVALRDELAPNVELGFPVDQFGPGDYLIPRRPELEEIDGWTAAFGNFYASLEADFDYLEVTVAYAYAGKKDSEDAAISNMPTPEDYDKLRGYVGGLVRESGIPANLGDLPFGNTVRDVMNDSDNHWRDNRVGYFLGDPAYEQLRSFRDVGVIGLTFSVAQPVSDGTCPCDAAGDGGDDDGGYFAEQFERYSSAGGMAL